MTESGPSVVRGVSLHEQPGLGALTIGGYLREVAARHGRAEAVVAWAGGSRLSWTYDDLLTRSVDVARALVATGHGRDARVGILMTNRPEFLTSFFGVALAGCVPVALSTFSTADELDQLLRASQIETLLVERQVAGKDFLAMIRELDPSFAAQTEPGEVVSDAYPFLRRIVGLGEKDLEEAVGVEGWIGFLDRGSAVSQARIFARANSVAPADPGGVFFSSGTTSVPKGILHSQRAFAIQWWRWGWTMGWPGPVRIWTGNGLFWSANIVMMVGIALSTGGTIVLQRMFEPEEALRLIEAEHVNFLNGRPHQWALLQSAPNWARADLSRVKYVTRGELIWQHPTVDTDWVVPMAFGTTETMTVCTGFPASTSRERVGESCGVPFPGNTLKIVDPVTRRPLPRGEVGEMCVKGPTLMIGYLGKGPEENFDDEGYYCTGDAGFVDEEGRFFWKGRMTSMIKTGGANVSPEEVDEVLALFPGVRRVQTVGLPDDLLGERVVACIVPQFGAQLDEVAIKSFAKARLAAFKVPRTIVYFSEDELAVTGSEKIKVDLLRELASRKLVLEYPA